MKVGARAWLRRLRACLLVTLVACATGAAVAQDVAAAYPSRPIRIVVGFAPGGPTDLLARELAARLHESWGQPVIVENKPGAGSRIAFEHVARAEPDGYTLLLGAVQTATNMAVYKRLSYDTLRDFAPVTQLSSAVLALAVSPSLKARSVAELVDLARARPGELSYATFGVASSAHFAGALFEQQAGIRITHVPYNGAAPAQTAIAGGQVDFGFMSALSAMPLLQSGKLRPIAVTAEKRLAQLPDVPTMAEAGGKDLAGFDVTTWFGVFAPAGTPPPVVARLNEELRKALLTTEMRERLAKMGAEPAPTSPAEFAAFIRTELAKYEKVVKFSGAKVD